AVITFAASASLLALGIVKPTPQFQTLSTVAIVFGLVGLSIAGLDVWRFLSPPTERMAWWYRHMANMIGSYIAAVTAFSVVNFTFPPPRARGLCPPITGPPLTALGTTSYNLRSNKPTRARTADPA